MVCKSTRPLGNNCNPLWPYCSILVQAGQKFVIMSSSSRQQPAFLILVVQLPVLLSLLLLLGCAWTTQAWIPQPCTIIMKPKPTTNSFSFSRLYEREPPKKGFLDFLTPYESKIPPQLREEIYAAEANTPAAQERGQRVAIYILIAFCGILSAFFNGFLTEIRANGPDGNGVNLADAGFDWVVDNPVLSFLFLNKIGGGISLLGGAGAGLLAEAELDTKRINAEKIYEELERRRQAKMKKTEAATSTSSSNNKKRKRPGKEAKRLVALSEVITPNERDTIKPLPVQVQQQEQVIEPELATSTKAVVVVDATNDNNNNDNEESKSEGLLGSLKSLYEKADTMAASQALLLNKQLEDAGIVEKITDETGLKVIGRDEAAKLKEKKEDSQS